MSNPDIERIKVIETFHGYPLDQKYSCTVFIGKSVYIDKEKKNTVDIPEEKIDRFFKNQGYIDGYTRIPGKGRYGETLENSEMILMFDKTLRNVLKFCYEYNRKFKQEAVYLEVNPVNQFEVKGDGADATSNK